MTFNGVTLIVFKFFKKNQTASRNVVMVRRENKRDFMNLVNLDTSSNKFSQVSNTPPAINRPNTFRDFSTLSDSAFIRISEAADLLSISKPTIYRMIKSGLLRTYKLTNRTVAFNVGELRAYLASRVGGQNA